MRVQRRGDSLGRERRFTVSADDLQLRIFLLDVVDHVDLIHRVALGGVLPNKVEAIY